MSDYVQLDLFENEGEVFEAKTPAERDWWTPVTVDVPAEVKSHWDKVASEYAQVKREMAIYYDLAAVTRGM